MRNLLLRIVMFVFVMLVGLSTFAGEAVPRNGLSVFVSVEGSEKTLVTLSNVWRATERDVSDREFWIMNGITNAPIKLMIPGGSALCIGPGHVLPYLIQQSSGSGPEGIWEIPPITLTKGLLKKTEISNCTTVAYSDGKLLLRDSTRERGVLWSFWSDPDRKLHIEVTVEPGW